MDDWPQQSTDEFWEAGFEGDRRVVISRLGPYRKVFRMPPGYTRRFYQQTYELGIEDWQIPLAPVDLGAFCKVDVAVQVRFQPTIRYVQQNLACLPDTGSHIKSRYQELLKDKIEQVLRQLEDAGWISSGHTRVERDVEAAVNETLTMHSIQCRTRCELQPTFAALEDLATEPPAAALKYQDLYREILRRRRELDDQRSRERFEQAAREQRLKLDHEESLLALFRRQEELRKARELQESERLKAEIAAAEERLSAQRQSEARRREQQIQHESRLNLMEIDTERKEKEKRFEAISEVDHYLKKEIELLVMEKQRMLLEQDIHNAKLAKAKGWLITEKLFSSIGETLHALEGDKDKGVPPQERSESADEK